MKTLVIYDNDGVIYYQASGDIREPNGLQFIWVDEVPNNKIIEKVNVETKSPVLKNVETLGMSLDEIKTYYVNKATESKANYLKNNPITFTCKGVESQYSIDEYTQNLLTKEIMMYTFAKDSGQDYTLIWRDVNGQCDFVWEIEDLKQLAYEINLIEARLTARLQEIKKEIVSCESEGEIENIDMTFE